TLKMSPVLRPAATTLVRGAPRRDRAGWEAPPWMSSVLSAPFVCAEGWNRPRLPNPVAKASARLSLTSPPRRSPPMRQSLASYLRAWPLQALQQNQPIPLSSRVARAPGEGDGAGRPGGQKIPRFSSLGPRDHPVARAAKRSMVNREREDAP